MIEVRAVLKPMLFTGLPYETYKVFKNPIPQYGISNRPSRRFYIVPSDSQETEPHVDPLPQLKLEALKHSGLDRPMKKLQSHWNGRASAP